MADEYTLGLPAMRQLRALVRKEMLSATNALRAQRHSIVSDNLVYIAYTGAGGVPALSGATPGSATVTLQRFDSSDDLENATDTNGDAVTVTAYNLANEAVAANVYVQLKQEGITGRLLVDFEAC